MPQKHYGDQISPRETQGTVPNNGHHRHLGCVLGYSANIELTKGRRSDLHSQEGCCALLQEKENVGTNLFERGAA